ncbi:hypothetical protein [Neobacillus vireti]|uniref:hypothetical protein n=1 Tax=Neobacillus vireti TaxID=220686 RepID=UPI003000A2EB
MKQLGLVFVLILTGCNHTGNTKQQINDTTKENVSDVSNKNNNGKAIGEEYGGKGAGYGQVKKINMKNQNEIQAYANSIGFNVKIEVTNEGVYMNIDYNNVGNFKPEEIVQKVMEVYGMTERPFVEETYLYRNLDTFLIHTDGKTWEDVYGTK